MSSELLEKAEAGDVESQCQIALLYEVGLDRPVDYEMAFEWWKKAADQGSSWALKKIAELVASGHVQGSKEDIEQWNEKANDAGYVDLDNLSESEEPDEGFEDLGTPKLNKKVLVADDDPDIRDLLVTILEEQGLSLIEAGTGKEALKALGDHPDIELMFVDLQMPQMNGFQFIKTIRNLKAAEGVPIVIVTAFTKPEHVARGRKLGVQGWIMKPFQTKKIRDTAKELLRIEVAA